METALRLLMRDGPVSLDFSPNLTTDQYDELLAIVQRANRSTAAELRTEVTAAAERWGVVVTFTVPVKLPPPDRKMPPG